MVKIFLMGLIVFLGVVGVLIMFNVTPTNTFESRNSSPTPPIEIPKETKATITTNKGVIELKLYSKDAPRTVTNFITKAKSGFYKNLSFHRVEDWVVQGGDPKGTGMGGGFMPVEFNNKPFLIGSVGVASRGDGKVQNDAQFFITKKDSPHLNGKYTNFAIVIKGIEVVNKITKGDKILGISVQLGK